MNAAQRMAGKPAFDLQSSPFIVGYHRVVEKFDRSALQAIPSMLISTSMLERHIDWLAKRFSIVSLDEIGGHLENPRACRKPLAAITFDDGYSDVYHNAYPLLQRKGCPGAVFVVTGLIGTGRAQVFDRLYTLLQYMHARNISPLGTVSDALVSMQIQTNALKQLNPIDDEPFRIMRALLNALQQKDVERVISVLENVTSAGNEVSDDATALNWEMLQTMQRNGWTIGSHTKSHTLLTNERLDTAERELRESRHTLEAKLKTEINHFAYPDGRFNPGVVRTVNSAGYRYAYGTCQSIDERFPLLTIPRKVLWERSSLNAFGHFSSAVMNCQAHWTLDRKDHCEHDHLPIPQAERVQESLTTVPL
jgi:peptidoglycan/xylan/chitin deacetylase (PgdA/CDA1 family)